MEGVWGNREVSPAGLAKPESTVALPVLGYQRRVNRIRDWFRFALASTAARSRASRDVLAARSELGRLRAEFQQTQFELGGAAYREDADEVIRLRERMRALEDQARELERGTHRAVGDAERQIGEERLAIQPTEIVPPRAE